jgi:hypothetical protein
MLAMLDAAQLIYREGVCEKTEVWFENIRTGMMVGVARCLILYFDSTNQHVHFRRNSRVKTAPFSLGFRSKTSRVSKCTSQDPSFEIR